jgi:hypothetical protein
VTAPNKTRKPRDAEASRSTFRPGERVFGDITIPSGKLAIFDIDLLSVLERDTIDPSITTCSVPADRPLRVLGVPVGGGRFAECWAYVAIELEGGDVTHSTKLGESAADFSRLAFIDHAALDSWEGQDSLDGQADCVFSGRDARILAHVMNAPRLEHGYGWTDLPLAEAESKHETIERKRIENKWYLTSELLPHTHRYFALAAAQLSRERAGTLEIAGSRMMLWFTSWNDGVFPIYLDLDHDKRPVQIRVQLAGAET